MKVLYSLAHYSSLSPPEGFTAWRREPDAGATGAKKLLAIAARTCRLAWRARTFDKVVLVTGGLELFVLAALRPKGSVVAVDWLIPASPRLDRAWPLSKVSAFGVVRRSDVETLGRRFGVPAERCTFVAFPVTGSPSLDDVGDDGYFYSAGWAHRDWSTLIAALGSSGVSALLSMPEKRPAPPNVTVVNQLTPAEGRQWLKRARAVVLAFVDTELPSGPLVLLDAMAHGKAVIVSDVGGSRDYVQHEATALVVPPGDASALENAIRRLDGDESLRLMLGRGAREHAVTLSERDFWEAVKSMEGCRSATGYSGAGRHPG